MNEKFNSCSIFSKSRSSIHAIKNTILFYKAQQLNRCQIREKSYNKAILEMIETTGKRKRTLRQLFSFPFFLTTQARHVFYDGI